MADTHPYTKNSESIANCVKTCDVDFAISLIRTENVCTVVRLRAIF